VTVGGSGVGGDLLRRVISSFTDAKGLVPALRMIVVAGRGSTQRQCRGGRESTGSRSVPYVHNLYRHLAACDLAMCKAD